jgi:hypothetical protein
MKQTFFIIAHSSILFNLLAKFVLQIQLLNKLYVRSDLLQKVGQGMKDRICFEFLNSRLFYNFLTIF